MRFLSLAKRRVGVQTFLVQQWVRTHIVLTERWVRTHHTGWGWLFALVLAAGPVVADERAGALADMLLAETGAPGVAVAYVDGGETGLAVRGVRVEGRDVAVEMGDLWHVGSITKSMTGSLIARLAARGVVSWEDTVGDVLGDLVEVHEGFRGVTYRELVAHQAGVVDDFNKLLALRMMGDWQSRDLVADRVRLAGIALGRAPEEAPGEAPGDGFAYSNLGYVVAGAMLEATTGEAWEVLVRREVFEPLGLVSAGFGAPGDRALVDSPWGHTPGFFGGLSAAPPTGHADNPPAFGPAGTVHMSAGDLLAYVVAHGRESPAFLPEAQWEILHSPIGPAEYAAGWGVGGGILRHDGSNTMWYARASAALEDGRVLVLLANLGSDDGLADAFDVVTEAFVAGP